MRRPEVLVLSGAFDFSTDLVSVRLREFDVPFIRLNKEHLQEYRFALDPTGQALGVEGPGIKAEIGPDLRSVWFRQPVFLRNTPSESLTLAQQLHRSQWGAFIRSLCIFDHARWMNFPQATYLAECKPYQLLMASRCGFRIPRTIVGNSALALKGVGTASLIVKSPDTVLLRDGEDCLFTYTTVSDPGAISDETVGSVPLMAQELLSNKRDIRVTVVGGKVFAVYILRDGAGIEADWRTSKDSLTYEDVALSPDIEESCVKLTSVLGLSFSAIDLVENDEGVFFIEINPTGEWGWISTEERQIDEAIAGWLAT